MKYRVSAIAPHRAGKTAAAVVGLITLGCVPFLFLLSANVPFALGSGAVFLVLLPFLYAAFAYLWIGLACLAYNWIARRTGGWELDIEPSGE